MTNNKQITVNQHFVPEFYLKRFANKNGFIEVLDLKNRRIARHKPFSGVCYEKYFYAVETGKYDQVSQEIESYFQNLENKLAPRYEEFIKKVLSYSQVTDEDIYYILVFMSMLWIRSEYFRENMNRMNADILKKTNKMRASHPKFEEYMKNVVKKENKEGKITDEDIKEYKELLLSDEYDVKFSNKLHLQFLDKIESFSNLFYGKNWRAYFAPSGSKFITSDTPVVEWIPKRTGFWGATFLDRKHYLTITPKVIIELVYPMSGKKFRRKQISKSEVSRFNGMRANLSLDYCYSTRKKEFEEMIKIAKYYNPVNKLFRHIK